MKQILIILGLLASVTTFAQSPRIKLNQITKDTVKGSVLISSPSDSGMVYSRDFYIAYGADTVLILYGDTLAATSGIISSVLSDGVTITGNGTSGNELKVDTLLIATIKALNDSLSTISASTTPDGVTITGDGSVGNPLKVDTATVISTIKGLVDTLTARGYLTANQTITLSGDVTGSGTTSITATVVDDSHDHIISNVDFLQDSLNAKANDSDLNNYLLTSNYIVDSTRINLTGDTAYYYQNGVLIGTGAIAGGGGGGSGTVTDITAGTFLSGGTITTSGTIALDTASAGLKTYISENIGTVDLASEVTGTLPVANGGTGATTLTSGAFLKGNGTSAVSGSSNLSETADTVYVSKFLNVDTATLYVDADSNRVGIGTSSPSADLTVAGKLLVNGSYISPKTNMSLGEWTGIPVPTQIGTHSNINGDLFVGNVGEYVPRLRLGSNTRRGFIIYNGYFNDTLDNSYVMNVNDAHWNIDIYGDNPAGGGDYFDIGRSYTGTTSISLSSLFRILGTGNVGIGTSSPSYPLTMGSGAHVTTGGVWTNASDIKLKENINYYYPYGLNEIINLKPTVFDYINGEKNSLGFIAQDVFEVIPEAISSTLDENGNETMGIKMVSITATLVKAIQEQQSEIDQLKTLITDLTNRLTILENK